MSEVDDQISLSDGQLSDYGNEDVLQLSINRSTDERSTHIASTNENDGSIKSSNKCKRKKIKRPKNPVLTRKRTLQNGFSERSNFNGNSNEIFDGENRRRHHHNESIPSNPRYYFNPRTASMGPRYSFDGTRYETHRDLSPHHAHRPFDYSEPTRYTPRNNIPYESAISRLCDVADKNVPLSYSRTPPAINNHHLDNYPAVSNNAKQPLDIIRDALNIGEGGIDQLLKVAQLLATSNTSQMSDANAHDLLLNLLRQNDFEKLSNTMFDLCEKGFNPSPRFVDQLLMHPGTPMFLLMFLYEKYVTRDMIPSLLCDLIERKVQKYDPLIVQIFYEHKDIFDGFSDNVASQLFKIFKRSHTADAILEFMRLRTATQALNSRVVFEALFSLRDDMPRLSTLISMTYSWSARTTYTVHLKSHTFIEVVQCFVRHPDINQPSHMLSFTNYLKMIRDIDTHLTPETLNIIFATEFDLVNERFILETVLWLVGADGQHNLSLPNSNGPFARCAVRHFHIYCLGDDCARATSLLPIVLSADHTLIDPDILSFWVARYRNLKIPETTLDQIKRVIHRLSFLKRPQ